MQLHLPTAKGAIAIASSLEYQDMLRAIGFQKSEWDLITSKQLWINKGRPTVERLLKQLIFSALDLAGAPRFEVPAEFVAGVLVAYISEVNYMLASHYIGHYGYAEELGNLDGSKNTTIDGIERCTASQLFSLMCQLRSDEHCKLLNRRFTEKAATSLEGALLDEEEIQKKPASSQNKSSQKRG